MAEPRKDRVLSPEQIRQMYVDAGLGTALRTQRIAGNETGDRELPQDVVLGIDQGRGRKQGNVIEIMQQGHG